MKITDKGLKHILSLGLAKESSQAGVYYLYKWEQVAYFCGSKASLQAFNHEGVFVELSSEQLKLLPKKKSSTGAKHEEIDKILNFYESALYLNYSEETKLFKTSIFGGTLKNLANLNVSSNENSPFRIVEQTKTDFHGFYFPIEPLNKTLIDLGLDTKNLWMTAVPVIKNNNFKGILLGLSKNQDYGLDILDMFKGCAESLKVA